MSISLNQPHRFTFEVKTRTAAPITIGIEAGSEADKALAEFSENKKKRRYLLKQVPYVGVKEAINHFYKTDQKEFHWRNGIYITVADDKTEKIKSGVARWWQRLGYQIRRPLGMVKIISGDVKTKFTDEHKVDRLLARTQKAVGNEKIHIYTLHGTELPDVELFKKAQAKLPAGESLIINASAEAMAGLSKLGFGICPVLINAKDGKLVPIMLAPGQIDSLLKSGQFLSNLLNNSEIAAELISKIVDLNRATVLNHLKIDPQKLTEKDSEEESVKALDAQKIYSLLTLALNQPETMNLLTDIADVVKKISQSTETLEQFLQNNRLDFFGLEHYQKNVMTLLEDKKFQALRFIDTKQALDCTVGILKKLDEISQKPADDEALGKLYVDLNQSLTNNDIAKWIFAVIKDDTLFSKVRSLLEAIVKVDEKDTLGLKDFVESQLPYVPIGISTGMVNEDNVAQILNKDEDTDLTTPVNQALSLLKDEDLQTVLFQILNLPKEDLKKELPKFIEKFLKKEFKNTTDETKKSLKDELAQLLIVIQKNIPKNAEAFTQENFFKLLNPMTSKKGNGFYYWLPEAKALPPQSTPLNATA